MESLKSPDPTVEYINRRRSIDPLDKIRIFIYGASAGTLLMFFPMLKIISNLGKTDSDGRCDSLIASMTIDPQADRICAETQAEFRTMLERSIGDCNLGKGDPTVCDALYSMIKVSEPK